MRKFAAVLLIVAALAGAGYFAARTPLQQNLPEDQIITEFADGVVAELAKAHPDSVHGLVPRDAHPKAHGCVKAIFRVDPTLPDELRVGSFALPGERFKAWIRFSNGAATPAPDRKPDFRGMAVKLIDADPGRADERGRPPHDIIMVNYPQFFLSGIADLEALARVGAFLPDGGQLKPFFFPGANPFTWRLRALSIVVRNATQEIASPLRAAYYSMTPYAFGPDRAIKYAARPCAASSGPDAATDDPDYLRKALQRELKSAPACFELLIQQRSGDLSVDDASQNWPEAQAPFQLLGRIEIPQQDFSAAGRDELCENLSFNPGHAPVELKPLGAINRARAFIYERIAAYRMGRNGVTPVEGGKVWDLF